MKVRTIPGTAFDRYLRVMRLPLDAVIRMLPGRESGTGAVAKLAVDRADATARAVAGSLLGDSTLREGGVRRSAAAQERGRAAELREEAARQTEQADDQLEQRHRQAERRRKQADTRAKTRRERSADKQEHKTRRAADAEHQRLEENRKAAARTEETIQADAPQARLEVADAKARALSEQQVALTESDEAHRLGEAASRAKEERKES